MAAMNSIKIADGQDCPFGTDEICCWLSRMRIFYLQYLIILPPALICWQASFVFSIYNQFLKIDWANPFRIRITVNHILTWNRQRITCFCLAIVYDDAIGK
jgi:hypothetical protein